MHHVSGPTHNCGHTLDIGAFALGLSLTTVGVEENVISYHKYVIFFFWSVLQSNISKPKVPVSFHFLNDASVVSFKTVLVA